VGGGVVVVDIFFFFFSFLNFKFFDFSSLLEHPTERKVVVVGIYWQ